MSQTHEGLSEPKNHTQPVEMSSQDFDYLTFLQGQHGHHKTFGADGKSLGTPSFSQRLHVSLQKCFDFSTLVMVLKDASSHSNLMLISGRPSTQACKQLGIKSLSEISPKFSKQKIQRNRDNFEDARTSVCILDIDGYDTHSEIEYTSINPVISAVEGYIKEQLSKEFHEVSYIIRLSQSAGLKGRSVLSVHLFFMLDTPRYLAEIKNHIQTLQSVDKARDADLSIYKPTQILFTANPQFKDCQDPVECDRVIFVKKSEERVKLPATPPSARPLAPPTTDKQNSLVWSPQPSESTLEYANQIANSSQSPFKKEIIEAANEILHQYSTLSVSEICKSLDELFSMNDVPSALITIQNKGEQLSLLTNNRYNSAFAETNQVAWDYSLDELAPSTIFIHMLKAFESNGAVTKHGLSKILNQILKPLLQVTLHKNSKQSATSHWVEYDDKIDVLGLHKRCAMRLMLSACYAIELGDSLKIVQLNTTKPEISLKILSHNELWALLSESVWFRYIKSAKDPNFKTKEIISLPQSVGQRYAQIAKHLPLLKATQTMPLLTPSGQIKHLNEGYDPDEQIFVKLSDVFVRHKNILQISQVTYTQAKDALTRLLSLFQDFPLGENDIVAVAALMSAILAPTMVNRPMVLICANTRGSGKTLLAQVISIITTGLESCTMLPWINNKDEFDKTLQAISLTYPSMVMIDNATGSVGSPLLDSLITSGSAEMLCRIYHTNSVAKTKNRALIMITGNNLSLKGDGDRRALSVNLLSEHEKPESRKDFVIQDIKAHALAHAAEYWRDVLTIVNAYQQAPEAERAETMASISATGSFQEWSKHVQAPLYWLTKKVSSDYNLDVWAMSQRELSSESRDEEYLILEALASHQARYGETLWWKSGDLLEVIQSFTPEGRLLQNVLPKYAYETTFKLGCYLQRYKNKRLEPYTCEHRRADKQNQYRIVSQKPLPMIHDEVREQVNQWKRQL